MHLLPDFRCAIHPQLAQANMKGCLTYDCFGAGQRVTQVCFPETNWRKTPAQASEIFKVFLAMVELHLLLWYLIEAWSVVSDDRCLSDIEALVEENKQMTARSPAEILEIGVEEHRRNVNRLLKKVSKMMALGHSDSKRSRDFLGKDFAGANLDGRDLSMSLLIAANLEGCNLRGANFLGADLRDARVADTDLTECIFLTQMQVNSAKGNTDTKLPPHLSRPVTWQRL
jgi:uncharacterized protein YjbI with pentapeptide repeats